MRLGELLADSFSGEWGSEDGEGVTAILRTANFNPDGSLDYSSPAYRCVPSKKVEMKTLKRGDILIEKSGGTPKRPVGIVALFDSDMRAVCSNFNHVLRFDSRMIDPLFAFHQLRWLHSKGAFERYTRKTTGLQNLEMRKFFDLPLTVPELGIQRFYINGLDLIEEIKKIGLRQLVLLDELVKSRFVEMFGDPVENPMGWEVSTIKETSTIYGDGPFGSNLKSADYVDRGVRVIRLGNIGQGVFLDDDRSYVSWEKFETLRKYECLPDEVVIATLGEPLLRACLVPDFGAPSIHKADCMYYAPDKERVLPIFAMCAINHPTMLQRAMLDMHGQTRNRINSTQVGKLPMVIPPLSLQREFASFAAEVAKSQVAVRQQIEKLQTLYDSLAQDYFG